MCATFTIVNFHNEIELLRYFLSSIKNRQYIVTSFVFVFIYVEPKQCFMSAETVAHVGKQIVHVVYIVQSIVAVYCVQSVTDHSQMSYY